MAPLNTGHLVWWLRQRIAEEPDEATRAELALTIDQCALQLWSENDAVRATAIATLLDLAEAYEKHPGYKPEWRRNES